MAKDLTGHSFGRLTVLGRTESLPYKNVHIIQWLCECKCSDTVSRVVNITGQKLKSGSTKSCGCLNPEARLERMKMCGPSGRIKYKGVCRRGNDGFRATFCRTSRSGNLPTAEAAARFYDAAAFAEWGTDCYLNFPEDYGLPAREPKA